MSDLPSKLISSGLWGRLAQDKSLQEEIIRLRALVEALASKISEQIPEFTDHSIKHFDSLWWVTDQVITAEEMAAVTIGEAFVLGGALYLHDLGMAIAATKSGADELRASKEFITIEARLIASGLGSLDAAKIALRHAARALHAGIAERFAIEPVPGLDRYLIEGSDTRSHWGTMIGQVAASHHWSVPEVERRLGKRGRTPGASGGFIDLGYVACALRIVDYAHINMDRASTVERLLRPGLPADSLVHWHAQEFITGPTREGDQLVYGSTRGIENVDAWWVFLKWSADWIRRLPLLANIYRRGPYPWAVSL